MKKKKAGGKVAPARTVEQAPDAIGLSSPPLMTAELLQGAPEPATEIDDAAALTDALAGLEHLRVMATATLGDTPDDETEARATLNDLLDGISAAKAELNLDAIQNHTISLQAASDELKPGIDELNRLKGELAKVTQVITDVDKLVQATADAVTGIQAVLKTFP